MASVSDGMLQLWQTARLLVAQDVETNQQEHSSQIQKKYRQLVSNITCLAEIVGEMFQEKKLTEKELENIRVLEKTPIRANEELLNIIMRQPNDVFECFLKTLKNTNQHHVWHMLVSENEYITDSEHSELIRRHYTKLTEKLDPNNGLTSYLYQYKVLTIRELEQIDSENDLYRKNEKLLSIISMKSTQDFEQFLVALKDTKHEHIYSHLQIARCSAKTEEEIHPVTQVPLEYFDETFPKEILTIDIDMSTLFPPKDVSKLPMQSLAFPPGGCTIKTVCSLIEDDGPTEAKTVVKSIQERCIYKQRSWEIRKRFKEFGDSEQPKEYVLEDSEQAEIIIKVLSLRLKQGHSGDDLSKIYLSRCRSLFQVTGQINEETDKLKKEKQKLEQLFTAALENEKKNAVKMARELASVNEKLNFVKNLADKEKKEIKSKLQELRQTVKLERKENENLKEKLKSQTAEIERLQEKESERKEEEVEKTTANHVKMQGKIDYTLKLTLIEKIETKASKDEDKANWGITILNDELFIVNQFSPTVQVYDSTALTPKRTISWPDKNIEDPVDIVSSPKLNCLYIIDWKFSYKIKVSDSKVILRVKPDGTLIKSWLTPHHGHLSVANKSSNIILAATGANKIIEFSPNGKLIREINLSNSRIMRVLHAVKLSNGHFLISHGWGPDPHHRLCTIDFNGAMIKSFDGKTGSRIGKIDRPWHFVIDSNGSIIVVDLGNKRVLQLNSELEEEKELLTVEDELRNPSMLFLDESNNRLFVVDNDRREKGKDGNFVFTSGRVLVFQLHS